MVMTGVLLLLLLVWLLVLVLRSAVVVACCVGRFACRLYARGSRCGKEEARACVRRAGLEVYRLSRASRGIARERAFRA